MMAAANSKKTQIVLTLLLLTFRLGIALIMPAKCREQNRPVDSPNNDFYILVDAIIGEELALQCHYCGQNDDLDPKLWYKVDYIGGTVSHEVKLDMNNNYTKNRVHVNNEHSLIIRNIEVNDTGLYHCERLEGENQGEKFNYLVDNAQDENRGWKSGKTKAFKYRKSFVLAEESHLTLICPESTLENLVVWKKNGKVLEPGESVVPPNPNDEPRITVDTFNTLYLTGVKESEEGNYTCEVDDIRMQQTMVFVVSKSKLLTQAFLRHMMYLGIILSLTFPCYLAGVVIACSRKSYFKGYRELREEEDDKSGSLV